MYKYLLFFFTITTLNCSKIEGANILGLLGTASPSHHIWNSALTHALAERGHNLTLLTPDLPKAKDIPKNAYYIHLEEVYNSMIKSDDGQINLNDYIGIGPIEDIPLLYDWSIKSCIGILKSKGLDVLLNYPDNFKFDLILHDFTLGPTLLGYAHKFKYPPIVGVSAFLYPPNTIDITGGHLFPSYVPFYSTSSYDINMSFLQRMHNTLVYFLDSIYRNYYVLPKLNQMMHHKYPKGTPYLGDIDKKTVIALVNSHPSINYPESLPPNIIEVGGMQIKDPKPLPKDLTDYIEKSKNGVILMAFGTNMHSKYVDSKITNILLDAMRNLPQYNFIWKFEHGFGENELPLNIMVRKFLPQSDILAHPKTKAFITHCGGLSTQEATWHGVPMIGIPLFVDQMRNMYKSMITGVGEKLDYLTLDSETLQTTIKKVAENDTYKINMKLRSQRFKDRPMKPLDTAVWWVEYILRDPEPKHLKPPTLNMNFIAINSLDFIFILIIILLIPIAAVLILVNYSSKKNQKLISKKKLK